MRQRDCHPPRQVSIHAFRGEGDLYRIVELDTRFCFNPRLPGGRRQSRRLRDGAEVRFQSTPSGGKATEVARHLDFPRAVSIHAFRGEGDRRALGDRQRLRSRFNPRLPGGRRPCSSAARLGVCGRFNPRLPGGRRRSRVSPGHSDTGSFNPRLPGGRRRLPVQAFTTTIASFQSTPSGGKATQPR